MKEKCQEKIESKEKNQKNQKWKNTFQKKTVEMKENLAWKYQRW